jgi:hypothetical protein
VHDDDRPIQELLPLLPPIARGRAVNVFLNDALVTFGDVARTPDSRLLRLPNMGPTTLKAVRKVIPYIGTEPNTNLLPPLRYEIIEALIFYASTADGEPARAILRRMETLEPWKTMLEKRIARNG